MLPFFNYLPFFVCFTTCGLLIFLNQFLGFGRDKSSGIQKFHQKATSRLGGLAIFISLIFTLVWVAPNSATGQLFSLLIFTCVPVFSVGLLEDITHKISPSIRLLLALVSSTLAYLLLDVKVFRTNIWFVDWLLQWPFIVYLFTVLVVAGFTHAINIIDGFNGLASGQILFMLVFLSYLNYHTDQFDLLFISISLFFITLGFFVWNWPFGKIFLGDGGAYLLGFCVVCLGLLLVLRSSDVSPFAPIMLGLYPLVEALFSIYRRLLLRGLSITQADAIHLHSLIFRRAIKGKFDSNINAPFKNSKVPFLFWLSTLIIGVFTCTFYTQTHYLLAFFFPFVLAYIVLFRQIVRFKTPHWLIQY